MISFIIWLISASTIIYFMYSLRKIIKNAPFKKRKYSLYYGKPDSFDHKVFYVNYEVDKEHKNYKDFDFDAFDELLKSKCMIFVSAFAMGIILFMAAFYFENFGEISIMKMIPGIFLLIAIIGLIFQIYIRWKNSKTNQMPFRKKKGLDFFYNYNPDNYSSSNYKNFYTFYEPDPEHKDYKDFDFNEFDRSLKLEGRMIYLYFIAFGLFMISNIFFK